MRQNSTKEVQEKAKHGGNGNPLDIEQDRKNLNIVPNGIYITQYGERDT